MHEGISIELSKLVQDGILDCAVIVNLMALPHLNAIPRLRERLYLIGPRKGHLRPRQQISLARVSESPLILTTRPNSLRLIVENALAAAQLPANIIADSNSTAAMVELAAEGLASTVLPYSAACKAIEGKRLSAAPIDGLAIEWIFVHPSARTMSAAARAYAHRLRDLARSQIAQRDWLGAELCAPEDLFRSEIAGS